MFLQTCPDRKLVYKERCPDRRLVFLKTCPSEQRHECWRQRCRKEYVHGGWRLRCHAGCVKISHPKIQFDVHFCYFWHYIIMLMPVLHSESRHVKVECFMMHESNLYSTQGQNYMKRMSGASNVRYRIAASQSGLEQMRQAVWRFVPCKCFDDFPRCCSIAARLQTQSRA